MTTLIWCGIYQDNDLDGVLPKQNVQEKFVKNGQRLNFF